MSTVLLLLSPIFPILRPSDGPGFVSIFANSRRTPTKFNEAYNIQTSLDTTKLNIIHDGMVGTVHCCSTV